MRSPWPTGPSSTTPTSTPTVRHTTQAPVTAARRRGSSAPSARSGSRIFVVVTAALRAGTQLPDRLKVLVQSGARIGHLLLANFLADRQVRPARRQAWAEVSRPSLEVRQAPVERPALAAVETGAPHHLGTQQGPPHESSMRQDLRIFLMAAKRRRSVRIVRFLRCLTCSLMLDLCGMQRRKTLIVWTCCS